jgi:hypothetical protein
MDLTDRHPATVAVAKHFGYEHLAPHLQAVSKLVHDMAAEMIRRMPDGPELTVGLRKLLEAKDAFVRAALDAVETASKEE